MTILEYLDVIKTYPMEDYFARYGEIEQVLKQAEEAKKLVTGNCGSSR